MLSKFLDSKSKTFKEYSIFFTDIKGSNKCIPWDCSFAYTSSSNMNTQNAFCLSATPSCESACACWSCSSVWIVCHRTRTRTGGSCSESSCVKRSSTFYGKLCRSQALSRRRFWACLTCLAERCCSQYENLLAPIS